MSSTLVWSDRAPTDIRMPAPVIAVFLDTERSLLSVEHDGSLTWDDLQAVKNIAFGLDACAIEIYPPASEVVNAAVMRHLWLLGPDDWWPNLGHEGDHETRTLRERIAAMAGRLP